MPHLRHLALPALLLLAVASSAQETETMPDVQTVLDPETGLVLSAVELVVPPVDLAGGWLELTPLASGAPASLVRLADRTVRDGDLRLSPQVADGAAMLCTGGRGLGVLCEKVYVADSVWVEPGTAVDVEVRFERGLALSGRYLLGGFPVAGARVAVVPAGLQVARAFTVPLSVVGGGSEPAAAWREVESDATGRFILPPVAEGEYFLETVLPSGRIHRSGVFELPSPAAATRTGAAAVWDLGEIDVADGLVVEIEVADLEGLPLAGARVAGRQGETPESLVSYETATDAGGAARLSGFSVEQGVHFSCRKAGYRTLRRHYPLLPVLVDCVLEPLAAVAGEVIGVDGLAPAGAVVSLEPLAEVEAEAPPKPVPADGTGRFAVGELAAGEYVLRAAAPGFEVARRTISLEPGQRLELEAIVLSFGRERKGQVVDAETGEPIAGVRIRAVWPPGAADTVSDPAGAFTLATASEEALVLRLSAPEHAGRDVTVSERQLEARGPLRFEMERGGWIRAVVWDEATDLPCQSCRLVVQPASSELRTDGHGEATSAPLAPGWYRVYRPRTSHLGSTIVEQDDAEARRVRVRRKQMSTVRFGERRRTVRVIFRPSPGAAWTLSVRTPRRTERYRPQPDGGFHVRHRRGETLDLYLHRYDPTTASEAEVRQATLAADLTTDRVVLPLAGAHLHGRATSGGAPLAGERVQLNTLDDATWATVRTRPDGRFSVPHLPPGVYAVLVGRRNVQLASLRPGQSLDLGTFELIPGSY